MAGNGQTANNMDKNTSGNEEAEVKEITMPIEQYEELSKDEITKLLKEEGAKNIQFKEDKTVVYEVPKKQYNEKKNTLQADLQNMINAVLQKDQYPSIQSVKVSNDYTRYQFTAGNDEILISAVFDMLFNLCKLAIQVKFNA